MTISILKRLAPVEAGEGFRLSFGTVSAKHVGRHDVPRVERRRSDRVEPGRDLTSELHRVGPSHVVSLSLGGATLDSPVRIEAGDSYRLLLKYGNLRAEIDTVTYRTRIRELFYAANGHSWIHYRSHVVFREPSVAALNLVYRVIADHWVPPADDDTRPASA